MSDGPHRSEGKPRQERAYRWWLRRIAASLRAVEDAYMRGPGSILCVLVACASALCAALYLGAVPPVRSNGLLEGAGPAPLRANLTREACGKGLNATSAARAMMLSAHFILYSQRPEGHFIEAYNWTGHYALQLHNDDEVQALALWALASFYREVRATQQRLSDVYPKGLQTRLHEAITNGISFFEINSRKTKSGARYIVYPDKAIGQLSVLAQVVLALVEVKRTLSVGAMPRGVNINAPTFQQTAQGWAIERALREHTEFLLRIRLPNGRFVRTYEASGRPRKQVWGRLDGWMCLWLVYGMCVCMGHADGCVCASCMGACVCLCA